VFESLKSYISPGPKLYGLEIFDNTSELQYNLLELKRSKDELVLKSSRSFTDWDNMISLINKRIPICLVYNTKDVLHKIVENPNKQKGNVVVEKGYPNLDFDRFYYNYVQFGTNAYIALLAKDKLMGMLEKFEKSQCSVIGLSLGISSLIHIRPYLNEGRIETASKALHFSADHPDTASHINNNLKANKQQLYELNGLQIAVPNILGFATLVGQFHPLDIHTTNYGEHVLSLKKDFTYARAYHVLLWPIIGFLLALLLGNFLAFNSYYAAHNDLVLTANTGHTQKQRIVGLKERVSAKEKRMQTLLSNKNSRSTKFLDEISQRIPQTISLNTIVFQPLSKPIRKTKEIFVDKNEIVIAGETTDTKLFSQWITTLEGLPWVTQVETLHYGYLKKNHSDFQVKISIK